MMFAYLQLGHSYIRIHLRKTLSNWAFWGEYHARKGRNTRSTRGARRRRCLLLAPLVFLVFLPLSFGLFCRAGSRIPAGVVGQLRSEEHTSELQSLRQLV